MLKGLLKQKVDDHGEIHAFIGDLDNEIEIRKGQVSWEGNYLRIRSQGKRLYFSYEDIVGFYLPETVIDN